MVNGTLWQISGCASPENRAVFWNCERMRISSGLKLQLVQDALGTIARRDRVHGLREQPDTRFCS
jgi:hypothetical protein